MNFNELNKQNRLVDFGKRSGLKIGPVSIGAMRLPEKEDDAIKLMRQAIDAGMIYIDTSRGYRDSEIKVGKSLKDGYRKKVILSTKWCPWNIKIEETDEPTAECTYKRLVESMRRLEVDYLDFYQIWNVNSEENWNAATRKGGMLDGVLRAKDEGLIRHIGFTTHDSPENISKYIDQADWCEAILFSYNIMNLTYKDIIFKAHEKGIGTIAMNPIGGGWLAEESPVMKKALASNSVVEIAHRYLAGDPNLDTILCGISKPSDITSTISNYQKQPLDSQRRMEVETIIESLSKKNMDFCTGCKYCQPCPQNINIPSILHAIYVHQFLKCPQAAASSYKESTDLNLNYAKPVECTECGRCEQKCPQKLKIIDLLKQAIQIFENPSQ